MTKNLYNFSDLEDSQILLEKEPPKFIVWLLIIVVFSFLFIGFWLVFGKKDVFIQGIALVEKSEELGSVKSEIHGKVKEITKKNGDNIKKGEIILRIDNSDIDINNKALNKSLLSLKRKLHMLEELRRSIEKKNNLFSEKTKKSYIYEFKSYIQTYEAISMSSKLEIENTSINGPTNDQIKTLEIERDYLIKQSANLEKKKKDTKSTEDIEIITNQINELESEISKVKKSIDLAKSIYNAEMEKVSKITENQRLYGQIKVEEYKKQTLANVSQRIENVSDEIKSKKIEANVFHTNLDKQEVRSGINGKIRYDTSIQVGNSIEINQLLATILPNNTIKEVKIYIKAEEKNRIKLNETVRIKLNMDNNIVVNGIIHSISELPITQENNSTDIYEVTVKISNTNQLEYGMSGKATISVGKERIWNFIMRKLDFID